ncbi:hypothetical protein [Caldicellulosiruptor changbaiensis]|uniref:hypothetical protein n=1 Tax=Caldicellulosiruptor changbaiensis TaxID=1222016 RepID=UPI001F493CCD|nr:hypothetical protein [Caldicellulosiruptor changbaiensis]
MHIAFEGSRERFIAEFEKILNNAEEIKIDTKEKIPLVWISNIILHRGIISHQKGF